MGRMSSKRIPGLGKSGNWRRADLSLSVRRESSAAGEAWGAESPPWAAWLDRVGSGWWVAWWIVCAGASEGEAVMMKGTREEGDYYAKGEGGLCHNGRLM